MDCDNLIVKNSENLIVSMDSVSTPVYIKTNEYDEFIQSESNGIVNDVSTNICNGHSHNGDINGFKLDNRNQSEQCYETSENILIDDTSRVKIKKTTEVIIEEVYSKESQRLISSEEMAAIFGNKVEFDKEILVDHDISSEEFNRVETCFDGKIDDNIISCRDVKEEHAFEQLSDDIGNINMNQNLNIDQTDHHLLHSEDKVLSNAKEVAIEEVIIQSEGKSQQTNKDIVDKKPGFMDMIKSKTRSLSRDRISHAKLMAEQAENEKLDKKKFKINLFKKPLDTSSEVKANKKTKKIDNTTKENEHKIKLPKFLTKKSKDCIELSSDKKSCELECKVDKTIEDEKIILLEENNFNEREINGIDLSVIQTDLSDSDFQKNDNIIVENFNCNSTDLKIETERDSEIIDPISEINEIIDISVSEDINKPLSMPTDNITDFNELTLPLEVNICDENIIENNYDDVNVTNQFVMEAEDPIIIDNVPQISAELEANANSDTKPIAEDDSKKYVSTVKAKEGWWHKKKKINKINDRNDNSAQEPKETSKSDAVLESKEDESKKHGTFPRIFSKKNKHFEDVHINVHEPKIVPEAGKGIQKKFSFGFKLNKKSDKEITKSKSADVLDPDMLTKDLLLDDQIKNNEDNILIKSINLNEPILVPDIVINDEKVMAADKVQIEILQDTNLVPESTVNSDINVDEAININLNNDNIENIKYENNECNLIIDQSVTECPIQNPKIKEILNVDQQLNNEFDKPPLDNLSKELKGNKSKSSNIFNFGIKNKSNKVNKTIADNGIELIAVKNISESNKLNTEDSVQSKEVIESIGENELKCVESESSDENKTKRKTFGLNIGKKNKHDNAMKEKNTTINNVESENKSVDTSTVPSRKSSSDTNAIDQKENHVNNIEKIKNKHNSERIKKSNQIGTNFIKFFSPLRGSKGDKNISKDNDGYEAIVYSVEEEGRIVAYTQKKRKHSANSINKVEVFLPGNKVTDITGGIDIQPEHTQHFIVVAIDFGTTFSGYAFSFVHDPDSIHMMRKWEGGDPGVVNQKTPTILLLTPQGEFHSFGFTARDFYHDMDSNEAQQWLYFERFKMNLYEMELTESSVIHAANGKPFPALVLFSYALAYFKKHAMTELSSQSSVTIEDKDIRWVITVPAIWRAPAKQFMREAAYMADIASPEHADRLLIALEPEAASICIRRLRLNQLMPERSTPIPYFPFKELHPPMPDANSSDAVADQINPGTRYMVVDCGGGTVDITVHEMEAGMGHLKELHKATGGPHGSTGVDRDFERLLVDIFGEEFIESFKNKRPAGWVDLMIAFESRKRAAAPLKDNAHNISLPFSFIDFYKKHFGNTVDVVIKKYGDNEVKWSVQGMLRLSPSAMQKLFDPTLAAIKHSIRNVFNKPDIQDIEYLFLVGGFSESPLLQHEIRKEFENEVKIIIPQDVSLAILRGAVQFGLDPTVVTVRRSRLTYGVGVVNHFLKDKHPVEKKVSRNNVEWCVDLFDIFVSADEPVALGSAVKRRYAPASADQCVVILHVYCSETSNVQFISDASVIRCATLRLDIDPKNIGQAGQEIEVSMTFADTEIKVAAVQLETGTNVKSCIDFLNK